MKHPKTMRRRLALFPLAIATLFPLWGCDIFEEGMPETAKVVLEGGAGESFHLVTTTDFAVTVDEDGENKDIYLYSADTVVVSAPYTKSYSLGSGVRFYLKAFSTEGLSEPVLVRVLIDGDQRYKVASTLVGLELEFLYVFR